MRLIGNILWLVLGGLAIAVGWAVVGVILCITIIGIPVGRQSFKMAKLALFPFGTQIV
ncbi:Inner membrane component domain-containing protein [Bifidobacterium pseudolongum subsp. globosum]|nr:YccF domain-containing protein [Bifidobacterium pseudolongum]RYQ01208.1 Inner membrane component domain-containing protein [Bifidobacterium pseudolongum subsp. globosum]